MTPHQRLYLALSKATDPEEEERILAAWDAHWEQKLDEYRDEMISRRQEDRFDETPDE